jgi:hypothetical protein
MNSWLESHQKAISASSHPTGGDCISEYTKKDDLYSPLILYQQPSKHNVPKAAISDSRKRVIWSDVTKRRQYSTTHHHQHPDLLFATTTHSPLSSGLATLHQFIGALLDPTNLTEHLFYPIVPSLPRSNEHRATLLQQGVRQLGPSKCQGRFILFSTTCGALLLGFGVLGLSGFFFFTSELVDDASMMI